MPTWLEIEKLIEYKTYLQALPYSDHSEGQLGVILDEGREGGRESRLAKWFSNL